MKRRTYVLWKRLLTRFAILCLVLGVAYIYFFTGLFTINEYRIVGAPENRVDDLKRQLAFVAEQKLFRVLPGNRSISFNDDEMRTAITEILPNTKDIHIYPSGQHALTIKLKQYEPLFSVSDTHAISKEGVVYREITPVDEYPRLEIASSTQITPERLRAIANLSEKISAVLYEVRSISMDEHDDVRLYDKEKRSAVIVSADFNSEKTWSNIVSAVDTEPLKGKLLKELSSLSYLDARFGNKVFYKFTNREETDTLTGQTHEVATTTIQ